MDFQGQVRYNLVTGFPEEYYPTRKRIIHYLISFIETLPILLVATALKIVIFNINGTIDNPKSIVYIEKLALITKEGGLLEGILFINITSNFCIVILISLVNQFYVKIAEASTARENHKSNKDYNSSLTLKRFLFELINRFSHFFYIAFISHDFNKVRKILTNLFILDEVKRLFKESILPIIIEKIKIESAQKYEKTRSETDKYTLSKVEELVKKDYSNYDDYIEVLFPLYSLNKNLIFSSKKIHFL